MIKIPHLIQMFFEAAWHASLVPFGHLNSFFATIALIPESALLACITVTLGSMLGTLLNWEIGRRMTVFYFAEHAKAPAAQFKTIQVHIHRYGFLALILVWIPTGQILTLLAGVFGVSLRKTLAITTAAWLGYSLFQAGFLL